MEISLNIAFALNILIVAQAMLVATGLSAGAPASLAVIPSLEIKEMVLWGAGIADLSRRTLDQAKRLIDSQVPGIDGGDGWADWLSAHLLYHEVEALIAASRSGLLAEIEF